MCFSFGVAVCAKVSFLSFLSHVSYLVFASFRRFSSTVCWMYGQVLFQVLARDMCRR